MDSGVRSSYATPLGLITISSVPGTRAETLPEVQATRPDETSSACSSQSSARSAAEDVVRPPAPRAGHRRPPACCRTSPLADGAEPVQTSLPPRPK